MIELACLQGVSAALSIFHSPKQHRHCIGGISIETRLGNGLRRYFYSIPILVVAALVFVALYFTVDTRSLGFYALFFVTLLLAFLYVIFERGQNS
jgi:uncharacterized membrane protein